MYQLFHTAVNQLKYWITPSWCAFCRALLENQDYFCTQCIERVEPIVSTCIVINKQYTMKVIAVSAYKDPLKQLIIAKHYSQVLASYQLGQLLWNHCVLPQLPCDYLIPIPLHWTRYAARGYNQAEIIANYISAKNSKPTVTLLTRNRRTKLQASLSVDQREQNVKNVFSLSKKSNLRDYEGKHLVLVDDLMTTGSTLHQAGRVLATLKPASITAAVVCRVI